MSETLPTSEYAFPGPVRDMLVAAILRGEKTTTTSLRQDYEREREALPKVGDRALVIDSAGSPVCIEEIVGVREVRLADVDLRHAIDEGEGFETVAQWREAHEAFWASPDYLESIGDPGFTVGDDTIVVLARFRVLPLG
ncbi:ASCH domain-containing protein [Streptomyces sp. NPDC057496]|uniref:ASCH domain-containing protein n=1 Tax=Streptomyces sp. NPDC057496 TaxID=3346149 RepID=UPI003685E85C